MKILLIALSFLLSSYSIPTNKKIVTGYVKDFKTNEMLAGVLVKNEGSNAIVYTDLDGKFTILASENDKIILTMISYKPSYIENLKNTKIIVKMIDL